MLKRQLFVSLFFLISISVNAQFNVLNAKTASQIGEKTEQQQIADNDGPIPYGYTDDRDVMWSKVVWEYIDLNQKINLPLYFPIDTTNIAADRRSLFDALVKGIRQNKIKEVYDDSYFTSKKTIEDIEKTLVAYNDFGDPFRVKPEDIGGYQIKGIWYFDKRQGELKYRLLALAPMGKDVQRMVEGIEDDTYYPLFWVFYPDAREVLHKTKVFNPDNSAYPISLDHLLNARRFNATIIKEENVYGDREIKDYIRGNSLFQLLEANRIKEEIRNKEIDMWNY